jgi:hypothetical protein
MMFIALLKILCKNSLHQSNRMLDTTMINNVYMYYVWKMTPCHPMMFLKSNDLATFDKMLEYDIYLFYCRISLNNSACKP